MPRGKRWTPVRVSLDSAHTYAGETNSVRLLTQGQYMREDGGFTLVYLESCVHEQLGPFTLQTTLVCGNERVSLERSAPALTSMVFDRRSHYTCQDGGEEYEGEGFRMVSDNVNYQLGETDGRINLSFTIMGEYDAGRYDINIKFNQAAAVKPRRGRAPAGV